MILVQQRKQAKIGFETFRSKYIKLCVSSDVGKKEIRSERKRTCFLRRSNMRFSIRALSINNLACVTCRRMLSKVKRMKYSASFKLQVVKFASDNSNNSAASRKFGIDEKLVRDWRRKIDNIKSLPKTKCADRGRKCQWPELEKKVVEWVEENRKSGLAVTRNLIRLHAKKTAQQMNIDNFLVSSGWCTWFMKRNKLVLRQMEPKMI